RLAVAPGNMDHAVLARLAAGRPGAEHVFSVHQVVDPPGETRAVQAEPSVERLVLVVVVLARWPAVQVGGRMLGPGPAVLAPALRRSRRRVVTPGPGVRHA